MSEMTLIEINGVKMEVDLRSGGLKFAYINTINKDRYEIVPAIDDELPIAKNDVLAQFDRDIDKKEAELGELQAKRAFFLRHFNAYFEQFATKTAE